MWKPTNRWQAFGVHIVLSFILFILLAAIIYFWWYPGFLFLYDGGFEGMKLIAGVDFLIGPFLTLCVYKVGKKSLKFDMACIAILQLACLSGGMWAVAKTRPIAVVFSAGSYATTNGLGYENARYRVDEIELLQQRWPVWLAVDLPEGEDRAIQGLWAIMGEGLQYNVENYVPYEQKLSALEKFAGQASDINDASIALQSYQKEHPEIRFFPMTTSMHVGYVAVDVKSGKVMDFFKSD